MIVLWNTLYINAALEQLAREGHDFTSEDVARLSPLVFEHINLLGRYAFSVPEAVTPDFIALRIWSKMPSSAFCSVAPQHPSP